MDYKTFLAGMQRIESALRVTLSELELSTYWDALSSLSNEAFNFAAKKAASDLDKFPVPKVIRELSRMFRHEYPQVSHNPVKSDPAYAKARWAIIHRVMAGQPNHETAKQITDLIDEFPAKAQTLMAEAEQWWNKPDSELWEM